MPSKYFYAQYFDNSYPSSKELQNALLPLLLDEIETKKLPVSDKIKHKIIQAAFSCNLPVPDIHSVRKIISLNLLPQGMDRLDFNCDKNTLEHILFRLDKESLENMLNAILKAKTPDEKLSHKKLAKYMISHLHKNNPTLLLSELFSTDYSPFPNNPISMEQQGIYDQLVAEIEEEKKETLAFNALMHEMRKNTGLAQQIHTFLDLPPAS